MHKRGKSEDSAASETDLQQKFMHTTVKGISKNGNELSTRLSWGRNVHPCITILEIHIHETLFRYMFVKSISLYLSTRNLQQKSSMVRWCMEIC